MENLNLIRKIAWSFHKTTGIPFEDLFSEACLGYSEALITYTPGKTSFSSHAWLLMSGRLCNFVKSEQKQRFIYLDGRLPKGYVCYQAQPFSEFFENLPKEVQELVQFILSVLDEIPDEIPPKLARGKITKLLRASGWKWAKIERSIKLLKLELNKV